MKTLTDTQINEDADEWKNTELKPAPPAPALPSEGPFGNFNKKTLLKLKKLTQKGIPKMLAKLEL